MQDEPAFERPLPEDIERIERILAHGLLQTMSIDEVLEHFSADEVLKHYPSDEVLKHYPSDEVLKHYPSDEVLKHYSIEDMQEAIRRKQHAPH